MLENYIVNKGANDQQARMLEMRAEFEMKEKQRKENYMKGLKDQLEGDTYRHVADRKSQIHSERQLIEQRVLIALFRIVTFQKWSPIIE